MSAETTQIDAPPTQMEVILISSGEWPSVGSLLFSQLFETARMLKQQGHTVRWFAAIPALSWVKRFVLRKHDLAAIREQCQVAGIPFDFAIVPISLGGPLSLLLRSASLGRAAHKLAAIARNGSGAPLVLHGRSYDAAELALRTRDHPALAARTAIASFDMRSWLPPEIPMGHGLLGRLAYGPWKEIEYRLLRGADARFLPLDDSRRQYEEETGISITFAPIQGFDRPAEWTPDFETRWMGRRIGYAGSLGQWNDASLLTDFFNLFSGFTPLLATHRLPELHAFECCYYAIDELPGYYDTLIAMVIPGLRASGGYFDTIKLRTNFFSTKAAEALSRGVPLIVSARLAELAAFVRRHDCGVVVDLDSVTGLPLRADDMPADDDKARWRELSENAARVGAAFTREAVMATYVAEWRLALTRRAAKATV